ncbi:MAG: histone deacetylase [Acidobacteria bacterium]|nr:histone deacetylase [Acidobacteriota bacterium]NIM60881.1 histone deacetylase [Acidobacteriota bacterium]NIO60415.1 histone deacetylase [Acidobacteriota bacterium]NIQ31510.1 histone deacetylase [Acidobacteriota bacterium]NIQ86746.1 histone deacetylase [Acidobacteriota bacterium]
MAASRPVGLVLDPLFEDHETGPGHPEHPGRLRRVREALTGSGLTEGCRRVEPRRAADRDLERAHHRDYIAAVERACRAGERQLDSMDTSICPESSEIARQAAGALSQLTDLVATGELARGFAAVRPPGHHAEANLAMGFCLFNNVVVAARRLQAEHGIERVFILDWDVHHGNGTQHILEDDPSVFYASLHQWPLYPGTGAANERGVGAGEGATLNCPLPPGADSEAFLGAIRETILPAAREFDPGFVLVSAGFDAHVADPLASLRVETEAYGEATDLLLGLADECCGGKFASVLEGGYDLDALAATTRLHLERLLDH